MRSFILSLSPKLQFCFIVFSTIVGSFLSALVIFLIFGHMELISKTGLITSIYQVLGTVYAVLIAFSVSGVWSNYCASEQSVTTEAAALTDLVHMAKASSAESANKLRETAIEYITEVISLEWPTLAKGKNEIIMSPTSATFLSSMQIVHIIQAMQPVTPRDNVIFSHLLSLLTRWLDARRTRIMISKGNIAKSLWPLLISALILFAFHGLFITRNPMLWSALLLFFSGIIGLSFYLIFTLDCPFAGVPVVDSEPFKWSLLWLKESEKNTQQKANTPCVSG
jgi:hypothetical protein